MGISGLNNFMTRFHKGVCQDIHMIEEIKKWKIQNDGQAPTILIDLKETKQIFVRLPHDRLNVAFGGCYDHYNKQMKCFLENFVKMDAKLVFFLPGKKYTDQLEFLIPAREHAYVQSLSALDKIEGYSDVKKMQEDFEKNIKWFEYDIRMISPFDYNMEKLVRRYGEVHVNYEQHNKEIARYAKDHTNEVLAIITNDTDFMAFDGDFQFWRAFGTNIRSMQCKRYCRRTLCADLGLNFHQIQLLGALSGSKHLPIDMVSDFLNGLVSANDDATKIGRTWNVSAYIKKQPYEVIDNKPKFKLEDISKDVFGEEYTLEQLNCIKKSLQIYDLEFIAKDEPADSFLKYCKKHNMFLYKLSTDDTFCVRDIEYIDFRNYKSKSYAELVVHILMKMCGILFKDNTPRPDVRKICMKHAHDEPFSVTEEDIVYPPMELPELFDLTFKRKKEHPNELGWSLLTWILELDGNFVKKLRTNGLAKKLSAVIITLEYLSQNDELTAHEANAILMTEYKISKSGSSKVELQNVPNIQCIRIAHLYVKMFVLISHCLEICGLSDVTNLIRFDGPLFLKTMEEFETGYEQQKEQLNTIGLDFFTN